MPILESKFSKDTINELAKMLVQDYVTEHHIVGLKGEMGAGKTTLVKAIMEALGSTSHVTSPSYSLVNEYETENGKTVYHLDLQRVASVEELWELGIEEYLDTPEAIVLIEWPEIYETELGAGTLIIELSKLGEDERKINVHIMK